MELLPQNDASPSLLDEEKGKRKPRRKRSAKIRATSAPPDDSVDEAAKTRDSGTARRAKRARRVAQPAFAPSSNKGGLAVGKPSDCAGCPLAESGAGFALATYVDVSLDNLLTPLETLRSQVKLLVQGEALGRNEADKKLAFVGDAGWWVRRNILNNAGVRECEALFDNTLRCWPPRNKKGEFYPVGEERRLAEQHCRRYDVWNRFPSTPLLLVGGKAMAQRLGVENVSEWHGHIERCDGRLVGCTYHPAAVMRNPNLLPLVIRETANLLEANRNPRVLGRPQVVKGLLPDIQQDTVFDLEWNPETNVLTVVGLAYSSTVAYSSYDVDYGVQLLKEKVERGDRLIGHNIIDADLPRLGIASVHVADTMILGHLVHAHLASLSLLDLGSLVRFYFPTSNWKHDKADLLAYNGYDCAYNWRLWEALSRDVTMTDQWHLVPKQQALARLAVQMHQRGVKLDVKALEQYWKEREEQRSALKASFPINPNSPKQIVEWARSLGIYVNDAQYDTLVRRTGRNAEFDRLVEYREDSKSLKTWFPFETNSKNVLLGIGEWSYPHFNVTGTDVARFSCSGPNYQNLPPHLRRFIVPRSDELEIVALDFSQIENRCVAWLAEDEQMLADFASGLDIHRLVAARIFNKRYEDVTPEQRRIGKITVHASDYGETKYNLAKRLFGNSKRESLVQAQAWQAAYFDVYHKTRAWQEAVTRQLDRGEVLLRNPFRRVRFVYAQNPHERMKRGCHFLGCSTAADITNERALWAVDALQQRLGELALPILIVHDEVVWEMPKGDTQSRSLAKEALQTAVAQMNGFVIPVQVKVGPNYGELVEE